VVDLKVFDIAQGTGILMWAMAFMWITFDAEFEPRKGFAFQAGRWLFPAG
jgi:hypothetical protein